MRNVPEIEIYNPPSLAFRFRFCFFWSVSMAITEIAVGANIKYACIGILHRDYYDVSTNLNTRDVWICFFPCLFLRIQLVSIGEGE